MLSGFRIKEEEMGGINIAQVGEMKIG